MEGGRREMMREREQGREGRNETKGKHALIIFKVVLKILNFKNRSRQSY